MNIFDYDKSYKLNSKFELKMGKQNIYVNYNNGIVLKTQAVLTEILNQCNGNISMDDIFENLAERYNIDSQVLKTNCKEVLESSYKNNLIYNSEDDEPIDTKDEIGCVNSIWVHMGEKCNLKCPFCYSHSGFESEMNLDYNAIIKFLSSIHNPEEINIVISGGEPFCYDYIYEFICELKELNFKSIQLITNGTIGNALYNKVIPLLDFIQFSLDGITEEVNSMTRGKGSFDKTIRSIRLAKEYNAKYLVVSSLPTKFNIEQLKDFPEYLLSLGVDGIHIPRFMPVGRGEKQNDIKPDDKKLAEVFSAIDTSLRHQEKITGKRLNLSYAGDWYTRIRYAGRRTSCGAATSTLSINYDGFIYPCPSLHKHQFKIGHIDSTFDSIMEERNRIALMLSVENTDSSCYSCKNKYFCGGNCKAVSLNYGNILKRNEECNNIDTIIETVLQEY